MMVRIFGGFPTWAWAWELNSSPKQNSNDDYNDFYEDDDNNEASWKT
jgi:hypothetical protein